MIKVVAALIKKDGKALIAKRATGNEAVFGKWEFPGGKVEPGETEKKAIEREIKEEFEMNIEVNKFIINNVCKYPTKTVGFSAENRSETLRKKRCKFKNTCYNESVILRGGFLLWHTKSVMNASPAAHARQSAR